MQIKMIERIDKIDMDNGFFPYAKDLGRVLSKTVLNSSQRAIISAVFDKTFGWHDPDSEKEKKLKKRHIKAEIDFNFFEEFTGISPVNISRAIKELISYKVLKREKKGRKFILGRKCVICPNELN